MLNLDSVYVQCYTRKQKELAYRVLKLNDITNVIITNEVPLHRDPYHDKAKIRFDDFVFNKNYSPDWAVDVRYEEDCDSFYYTDGHMKILLIHIIGEVSTYQDINGWEIIAARTEPKWEPDCSVGDRDFKILYEGKEISAYVDENGTEYFDYNENIQLLRTEREKLVHFIKSVIVPEPDEKLLYKLYDLGMLKMKED